MPGGFQNTLEPDSHLYNINIERKTNLFNISFYIASIKFYSNNRYQKQRQIR